MKTWLISDTHLGWANGIHKFHIRDFASVEEMDETIYRNWRERVADEDLVYHLGDLTLRRPAEQHYIDRLNALPGRKILILGNHDHWATEDYLKIFEKVLSMKVLGKPRVVLTHIPVHKSQIGQWKANIHGHTHDMDMPHSAYFNVCVEKTEYAPILLDDVLKRVQAYLRREEEPC